MGLFNKRGLKKEDKKADFFSIGNVSEIEKNGYPLFSGTRLAKERVNSKKAFKRFF